jgi:hypothetical protein
MLHPYHAQLKEGNQCENIVWCVDEQVLLFIEC